MNFDPPYINSNIFNASYFTDLDDSLTLAAADLRYLKLSGGVVSGLTTFSNSLNVIGSLSINGSAIDLSLISGVTAGTPQASKALSLNALSQIDGNLQFATSRKILMNNSSSSGAYIDMGATASDRCISLFSDAASYYGFGAGGSQLRSFSKTDFAWYTGATQSVIGSTIMSLTSAGLLTTTSLALSGTITGITGLSLTGVLTSSNATVSTLNSNGALVLSGGIGISNTTDATSSTNGGTFTTAGGVAIAKSLYVGNILNVSGVSATSNIKITTTANYNGVMDTASLVLKQASVTNGNKIGLDFMISTNDIDAVNTATCSIVHERLSPYVGDLIFLTKRTATATNPLIEALRISSTGTCSIANTSSGFQLDLGASGTGINTNALTTTSLTLGATAITATGIELNYLDLTTGAGTAEASKALVLDSSKNIATINNLGMSGILTMTAASTTIQMTVPNSIARSNFQWTGDTGVQWEYGMRGSSNTPANALYWYSGGYRMILFNGGQLTVGGQETPSTQTLQVNHATGSCLRMTYNLTSNQCDMSVSSGGILTIAPSGSVTAISGTTGSTSNTTGALTLSGGIGISLTTDATSITNGGSFTTAGGIAVAKSVWCGGTITVNKSTSSSLFAGYSGTSNFTVSGLLNSDITIGTGSSNNLNIMTGNTTAMTIDGFTQNISGITSLSANFLTANSLTGTCATAAQPFITSLGVLTSLSVSGTLTLGGTAITASAAELNYCDLAGSAGTAEANKVMTLDASKNIATVNRITSNYLTINTAINAASCIASLLKVDLNNISTAYGLFSAKASSSYLSPYFGSSNSMFWAENANASVIEFEINVSNGAMSTSTNPVRMGTCTANDFSLFTAATERLLIRSGGAVAIKNYLQIGDSVDTTRMLSILDNTMTAGTSRYLTLGKSNNTGNQAEISFNWVGNNDNTNALTFGFHGGEKCRLSKYGSFLINSTSYTYGGNSTRFAVNTDGTVDWAGIMKNTANSSSKMFGFMSWNDVEQGSIQFGTGSTSYNTSSDYRLKKDIMPMLNGLELISRLRPVRFKWKSNDIESDGFIAHELQEVIPCVVVGEKDALYPNGSINPQGADYGKLTPHIVSAVKELTDINIALSKKIEDLESKVKNILSYDDLNKHIKLITKQVLKDYTVE